MSSINSKTFGPFHTQEAGVIIMQFMKNELLPCTKDIRELAVETSQFRARFWNGISKKIYIN